MSPPNRLCPALEALQVLLPLLRARSYQPYFNRSTLSPRSGPPPLGSRHNRPALPQPPIRILSRALRPRTQITQTGAPFLMCLLPALTVSSVLPPPPAHGLAQSRCTWKFWLMRAGGGQPGGARSVAWASWGPSIINGIAGPNPLKSPFLMDPGLYP